MFYKFHEITRNIQALQKKQIIGCELGVHKGENAEKLLELNPTLKLIMVDRWTAPKKSDSHYASGSMFSKMPQETFDRNKAECLRRIEPYKNRCEIIEDHTWQAAEQIPDESLDFVFVDADHSYDGCKRDIQKWLPKIKKGGFIAGHDYGVQMFPGVKKAVDEMFQNVIPGDDFTWFADVPYMTSGIELKTISFDYEGSKEYADFSKVLKYSIRKSMPYFKFDNVKVPAPEHNEEKINFVSNNYKTQKWCEEISKLKNPTIMLDSDLVIRRDLSDVFQYDFDIALTHRKGEQTEPINTGVVFIRPSEKVTKFFKELAKICDKMISDTELHEKYRSRYAGIMQAALGWMLENEKDKDLKIKYIPTRYYNAADQEYMYFSSATKVLHIKESLRKIIRRKGETSNGVYKKVYGEWKIYAYHAGVIKEAPEIKIWENEKLRVYNVSKRNFQNIAKDRHGKYIDLNGNSFLELPIKIAKNLLLKYPKELKSEDDLREGKKNAS